VQPRTGVDVVPTAEPGAQPAAAVDGLRMVTGLLFGGLFLFSLTHVFAHFIDYPVYHLAARRVLEGRPLELYDLARQSPGGYYYPYFFALCFTPFVLVGDLPGKLLFFLLFWLSYWRLLRFSVDTAVELVPAAEDKRIRLLLAAGVTIAAVNPLNDAFMNANIGLPLAAMAVQAWAWRARRPVWSGVLLGVAIVFKLYPAIVLGWFIWARHWRAALTAIAVMGICYLSPLLIYGPEIGLQILSNQAGMLGRFGIHWRYDSLAFQNLHATLMRWGSIAGVGGGLIFRVSMLGAALAIIAFYLPSFLRPPSALGQEFRLRMFALTLALVPIVVPVSWYNMALFYLPIIAILLGGALAGGDWAAGGAVALFFAGFTLTGRDVVGRALNDRLEFAGVPFLSAAILVGLFAARLVRRHGPMFRLAPRPA
jgi:glycosyl transferase family 87